MKIIIDMFRPE